MNVQQVPPTEASGLKEWIGLKRSDSRCRPFAVIMKSADRCNYFCDYCYVEDHCALPIMPIATALAAIEKVLAYVGPRRKVNFIWHGGEPLLAGRRFYQQIADFCRQYHDNKVEHCIQTNGALATEQFLDFCKETGFTVSLSLDGPEDITDAHRHTATGAATFQKTMRTLAGVRARGMAPGCVCVLHQGNAGRVEDLYRFFSTNRINVRINPVVKSGRAATAYNNLAITPAEFGTAMCRLFDLWFDDDYRIQLEPLYTILGNMIAPTVWGCDYHGKCLESIIAVNPDGSVYPCGRFAGMKNFRLGNILQDSNLDAMFAREPFVSLNGRGPETVEGCAACDFVNICNSGCMVTAYMARQRFTDPDYYCEGRRMLFRHIANRLKRHLENIQEE